MNTMIWTRPKRRLQSAGAALLRLLTLALMVLVFGLLAAHHSDADPIGAAGADVAAASSILAADTAALAGDFATTVSASVADNGWFVSALTTCAALGLCAVLGMALLRRALHAGHPALSDTTYLAFSPAPRSIPVETVAAPRPSLLVLSISRT